MSRNGTSVRYDEVVLLWGIVKKADLFVYNQNRPAMRELIPVLSTLNSLGNRFKAYAGSPKYKNRYYKFLLGETLVLNLDFEEPLVVFAAVE